MNISTETIQIVDYSSKLVLNCKVAFILIHCSDTSVFTGGRMATALKLGELLVQEKVITPHQLEEALKYQVIFGGKLGTNLIELDFVKEDDIAKTLSKMLRVPLVTGDDLNDISQDVIDLIPRDMAEQYQAIPFQLENRKLTLVMANPADLKAIDEIAFRTGFIVRPAVAPEVRLILALENHYHIPREIRYVQVSKKVEGLLDEPAPPKAAPGAPAEVAAFSARPLRAAPPFAAVTLPDFSCSTKARTRSAGTRT